MRYLKFICLTLLGVLALNLVSCKKDKNEPIIESDIDPLFEALVAIDISSAMVNEDVGEVEFTISLDKSNTSSESIVIDLTFTGMAEDPTDYIGGVDFVMIPVDEESATFAISIIDDEDIEEDETITVTLNSDQVEGITLGNSSVILTILDNDIVEEDECPNDNSLSTSDIGCTIPNPGTGMYTETLDGSVRVITANSVPNHKYGDARNQFGPVDRSHNLDATPTKANSVTSILGNTNRPLYVFGIALNGVVFAPAPATPFIFENTSTGEYNWEWVFEPTNNKGPDDGQVKLDCSGAHFSGQGYHYHGNMVEYVETIHTGLSSGTVPSAPVHIGWAADGFPIVYLYGPDVSGDLKKLTPSYQVKSGSRTGDGISAPCGPYNGKYTIDYEYVEGLGDLDECNGVDNQITLETSSGTETFSYYYVITETFPQIGRCFVGSPDQSFR